MTRVKRVPTYSRYLVGHNINNKVDLLGLSRSLLTIESPYTLWKLSTHLTLSLNFGAHLIRGKAAYIVAKVVPHSKKKILKGFWYKIFNITQNKEVYLYSIEAKIPKYSAALVDKVLVKSIRPESSWLCIQ